MPTNVPLSQTARWATVVVIASAFAYPAPLPAQGGMTCNQAKAILVADTAQRADMFRAASHILGCLGDAPGAIATGLRGATAGSMQDTVLTQDAHILFDRRLVDSVRALAVDQSQALAKRQGYLLLLTRYISPGTGIDFTAASTGKLMALSASGGREGVTGSQPIDGSARERALLSIYAMKQNDSDAGLRALANMVYRELYYRFH